MLFITFLFRYNNNLVSIRLSHFKYIKLFYSNNNDILVYINKVIETILFQIPQSLSNIRFDNCYTPSIPRPMGNDKPKSFIDSNNLTAMAMERSVSDYISAPFYNVFKKPQGVDLFNLCIIQNCKYLIQVLASDIMLGLNILAMDRQCYLHGNIRSMFFFYFKIFI